MIFMAGKGAQVQTPSTNASAIDMVMELRSWDVVDLSDAEALQTRIWDYYRLCQKYDTKPLLNGLCMVIGCSRDELMRWSRGEVAPFARNLTPDGNAVIKRAIEDMHTYWEFAFQNNGYRNPVTGIFLGKNNFGYKDTTENISVRIDSSQLVNPKVLQSKYADAIPIEARVEKCDDDNQKSLAGEVED